MPPGQERTLPPRMFKEAVDNAGHAIVFTRLDGTIEYVNPAFEETTGYEADEVIGKDTSILQSGIHDADFYSELWEAISEGQVWEGVIHNKRKNGEPYIIEQTISPIQQDGTTVGYVAVNNEITDMWKRERKIEALHEATRELLRSKSFEDVATGVGAATDAILDFPINVVRLRDGDRLEPVHVDEQTRSLLGDRPVYHFDESPVGEVFREGDPRIYDDVQQLDDDYDRGPVHSWLYVPIGSYGVISVGQTEPGSFTETDVRLVEILATNAETVLRSLEHEQELQRENERLERFAKAVSHDLRNPLNVAEGTLEQMREFTEQLDRMTRAHQRMEEVIEGVLTLARQGQRVEETEAIDMSELASDCWSHVSTPGAALAIESNEEFVVEADDTRCKHLFENLFRNAITHGNATTVTVGPLEDGFYVEDDGTGIPADKRDDVFDTGYTTATYGTGLGLSIVKEISDAHGWEASLTESDEGGARFEFRRSRTY
ncbi:ATP-binding protein (plasmid) [Haloferax sp. S1W]|uniref:sensor histidine kinase n=1 Tax=Haloferax sp. S1W TaxID=3377110 RepID=UPI0037CADE8A